jgi:hypothetical protein
MNMLSETQAVLTPYDEYPVHQAPYPFSYVPSTDYNWDEGYYMGVFSPAEKVFLATGLRINPNSDMIGGYALLNVGGQQHTVRFSRCWRGNFDVSVGPLKFTFAEPMRRLNLRLQDNDSGLSFDLDWYGTSPPVEEAHHVAVSRGRRTTDQTRYSQAGTASGVINFRGKRYEVTPDTWCGARDHSWGLYAERPPLGPAAKWLPPRRLDGPQRAMRFWTCFRTEPFSGFYHLHETADGVQCQMADVFGTPLGGTIHRGWTGASVELASCSHQFEFKPGTRILRRAVMQMVDHQGGRWKQEFVVDCPPWIFQTNGYTAGSWKDGGSFHCYHGSESPILEWDDFDFRTQPFRYTPHGEEGSGTIDSFNAGFRPDGLLHGVEYLASVKTWAPDGSLSTGAAQIEHFINGPYRPYGFE